MVTILVLTALLALVVALVVAVAFERGPTPGDVAVAYELAWDRLDFAALWILSSAELRDGRGRADFVADKQSAYRNQPRLRAVVEHVEIEGAAEHSRRTASVLTRLDLRDEAAVHNEIRMQRIHGSWRVVAYALRPEPASTP
ncbi:MAG: hypothetical protein ACXW2C_04620 [Acidimicrobiia bacterium]